MSLNLIAKIFLFLFILTSCKEASLMNLSLKKNQDTKPDQDDDDGSTGGTSGGTTDSLTYFSALSGANYKLYSLGRDGDVRTVGTFPAQVQVVDQFKWNEKIYFSLRDNSEALTGGPDAELWSYDIASGKLSLEKDVNGTAKSSEPANFAVFQNKLFFSATDGSTRYIYSYDGNQVSKITGSYSDPSYLTTYQGAIYFSALSSSSGYELFRYNGSSVSMVEDVSVGARGSFPQNFVISDNKLYFIGTKLHMSGSMREGMFVLDGVAAPNDVSSVVNSTTEYYKDLYRSPSFGFFVSCYVGTSGSMPCKYNPATNQVTSIISATRSMKPTGFIEFNGAVYFSAFTIDKGFEIYKYNGTTTTLAKDINPGSNSSTPSDFFVHGDYLYFSAYTPANGSELWRVAKDGSISLHQDLNPGTGSSYPRGGSRNN